MCIHGGGWVFHSKEDGIGMVLPYLDMGLSVVNVNYRLAGVAPAPAAVEDCRMALRWVIKNAKEYGFDTDRIIITGRSAGGHLALTTGMMDSSFGLDMPENPDYANIQPKAAAIINWFGITDVKDIISGENATKNAASYWLGAEMEDNARFSIEYMLKNISLKCSPRVPRTKKEVGSVARAVSPMSYVRKDLPPVFTVHGDHDNFVPYEQQAVKLHNALTKAGVPNKLMTIKGAGHHGGPFDKQFSREDMINIYAAIKKFLKKYRIIE